jgi:membrane protein YdbS with pleckstrin-like domain
MQTWDKGHDIKGESFHHVSPHPKPCSAQKAALAVTVVMAVVILFLVEPGFELRAWHLQSRHSAA